MLPRAFLFEILILATVSLAHHAYADVMKPSRSTLKELSAKLTQPEQAGTGMAPGLTTYYAVGDGKRNELFSLIFKVPPNSRIEAHSHPDARSCFVLQGTWYLGYGDKFEKSELKALPPGSHYTEPAGANHFAATRDSAALVECTGVGPTGTKFANSSDDPSQ